MEIINWKKGKWNKKTFLSIRMKEKSLGLAVFFIFSLCHIKLDLNKNFHEWHGGNSHFSQTPWTLPSSMVTLDEWQEHAGTCRQNMLAPSPWRRCRPGKFPLSRSPGWVPWRAEPASRYSWTRLSGPSAPVPRSSDCGCPDDFDPEIHPRIQAWACGCRRRCWPCPDSTSPSIGTLEHSRIKNLSVSVYQSINQNINKRWRSHPFNSNNSHNKSLKLELCCFQMVTSALSAIIISTLKIRKSKLTVCIWPQIA